MSIPSERIRAAALSAQLWSITDPYLDAKQFAGKMFTHKSNPRTISTDAYRTFLLFVARALESAP